MKLVVASNNSNKVKEISETLGCSGIVALSFAQAAEEFNLGSWCEVEETEDTYFGNARLKADAGFAWAGMPVLADDSGIEVDALQGGPGVFSARYGGVGLSTEARNRKLLDALAGVAERTARMRTILCAKLGIGQYLVCEGMREGVIAWEPRGRGGWGYEPIFVPTGSAWITKDISVAKPAGAECAASVEKELGFTVAELRDRGEEILTHRGQALRNLVALFESLRHS